MIFATTVLAMYAAPASATDVPVAMTSNVASAASLDTDSPPPADNAASSNDWQASFTPYLWVAGISGDIGIPRGDGEVSVDRSFADILGSLNFVFMGTADLRHKRFVAMADLMYLNMSMDVEGVRDPQFLQGSVDQSVLVSTLSVGYRLVDQGPFFIDVLVGGRLVSLDTEIDLEGPFATRNVERSSSNISPLVGGRIHVPLSDSFSLAAYGDVGGLGKSDVKWQLVGTAQWDVSRHWRVLGGYRYLALHHDESAQEIDIALSGPLVGFSYKF